MTPNRASPQPMPAGGRHRRRQADDTPGRSIPCPGPPIAPASTGLGGRECTLRYACRDRSAKQAVACRHQTGLLRRPRPSATIKSP
jgi:hypothetical protein